MHVICFTIKLFIIDVFCFGTGIQKPITFKLNSGYTAPSHFLRWGQMSRHHEQNNLPMRPGSEQRDGSSAPHVPTLPD